MIPWFELHVIPLGPVNIQVWGTLVASGFLAAIWLAARRAKKYGIPGEQMWSLAPWVLFSSFVFARIFHVLFYDFGWYLTHPLDAINPALPGYSMMGGVIGGVLAGALFIRKNKLDFWKMADLAAFALPLGTGIGRIGCFLIHDHPGTLTDFILGVRYPDGVRHDHGFYLSLLGWAMLIVFFALDRKPRPAGFFAGWYLILDGSVRFFLDFYRINDIRYVGLTPTQWTLFVTVAAGIFILIRKGRGQALANAGSST